MKSFDAFARPVQEFQVKTAVGGYISIGSICLVAALFLSELRYFLTLETKDEMLIDQSQERKYLNMSLDVTFSSLPCSVLGVNLLDPKQNNVMHVAHEIFKERLTSTGEVIGKPIRDGLQNVAMTPADLATVFRDQQAKANHSSTRFRCPSCFQSLFDEDSCCNSCKEVREAFLNHGWDDRPDDYIFSQCIDEAYQRTAAQIGEGCRLKANLHVRKVPATLHVGISQRIRRDLVRATSVAELTVGADFTHHIHNLSFGPDFPGLVRVLDGRHKSSHQPPLSEHHQYDVHVIPTRYLEDGSDEIAGHQYSVTEYVKAVDATHPGHEVATTGIWMSYDFTPFEVRVTSSRKSLFHFFTECCAILGGIFAFSGMLDGFAHQIHKQEVLKTEEVARSDPDQWRDVAAVNSLARIYRAGTMDIALRQEVRKARQRLAQAAACAKQQLDLRLAKVRTDCREMLRSTAMQWERAVMRERQALQDTTGVYASLLHLACLTFLLFSAHSGFDSTPHSGLPGAQGEGRRRVLLGPEVLTAKARRKLKAPVSRYELRVFWRRLDEDNSGQASVEEFGRLMYKIELSQWPDLTDDEIWRVVGVLNQAAHKWHRAGGNWFKIFNQIDADGSGNLSFDELVQCVRGTYPCLRVPTRDVKERELQGLWKALDDTGSIEVPVHRFMVFMRRWSADASFKEQKQRAPAKSSLPPVSERSGAEVRGVAQALERALSSYYIDKGYLSVASACEAAAWQGGAKVNDTACSWTRFFMEMDKDRSGRLSYGEFVRAVFSKLKTWMDPKVSLPVGGTGRNVLKLHLALMAMARGKEMVTPSHTCRQEATILPCHAHFGYKLEEMCADPTASTFAEATRLLLAVLGFICEGACPPMLRNHVVTRGPYSLSWHGISPTDLLREWFDGDELLALYAEEDMRRVFEPGRPAAKCQFITLLSRVALVEAARPGTGRCLRAKWQDVFQLFPEISLISLWTESCQRTSRGRIDLHTGDRNDRDSQRFFLKGTADLDENQIREHFKEFGKITNCNVLMDKRKKQFRGMCFLTMKPEGFYKGRKNTKQDLVEWMLAESHVIKGKQLEVTQADEKPEEDEDRKREERVEERRLTRLDKDHLFTRTVVCHSKRPVEDLSSRFFGRKYSEHRLWDNSPKGLSPISWKDANLSGLCSTIWSEIAEHATRTGDKTVKEALAFFRDFESDTTRWLFIPGADILLIVGDGLLTLTALGIFVTPDYAEPVAPPTMSTLVNIVIPTFASTHPAAQASPASAPQMPQLSFSARPELNRMQKGNNDDCKIFVGGLPLSTTLDQLLRCFVAYGQVTDAVIMTDKMTGKPRGFAFICYETAESVLSVLQHHDKHHVNGKWVDVKRAIADFLPGPRRMEPADAGLPAGTAQKSVGNPATSTKEDIRALWDKLDPSSVGEVTAKDMMLGLYHVQLDGWPELDGVDLERIATIVNHAAVKRLRTSGNWYKIFNLVDKGQSGRLSFGGLREVVRDMWYGLAIPPDQITEFDLKGLWKALDEDKSSTVSVGEFMVFMRRYGAKHSMQKSSQSKMTCSVISEEDEEQKEQIANAPELDAHQLVAIATNLTLGVHSWLSRTGADKGAFAGALLWPKFIDASESSRNGRMRFTEFHKMVVQVMRPPPSLEQLMAFWREVDQEGTGEVTASHFDNAVYRLQVDTWPELDQQGIFRVIHILNTAADKWHRASGNWYKVFLACDEDGSGSMTFDEMVGVCRKNFPGLSISPQTMPERDIRGFWRALDAHRAGRVEVYDFMIFMRKYGAQLSMHRSVRNKTATTEIEDYGKPPERSDDELRHTSKVLDESLTAYWNRRGVHVRAVDKWQRFLDEADLDRDGLVTFQDLEQALIMRLKAERKFIDDNAMLAFSSKVLAQFSTDGAVVNGVSHDDLYALWCRIAVLAWFGLAAKSSLGLVRDELRDLLAADPRAQCSLRVHEGQMLVEGRCKFLRLNPSFIMAPAVHALRWGKLLILGLHAAWGKEFVTYRWYGHRQNAPRQAFPSPNEICLNYPAACLDLYVDECVMLPRGMRLPWDGGVPGTAGASAGGEFLILRVENSTSERTSRPSFHVHSGCNEGCGDCSASKAILQEGLPSVCGATEDEAVFGWVRNSQTIGPNPSSECLRSLDDFYGPQGEAILEITQTLKTSRMLAVAIPVSLLGLLLAVVVTMGIVIYLRLWKREVFMSLMPRLWSSRSRDTTEPKVTKEQVEAALPIIRLDVEETCSVCLETVELNEDARRLKCQHAFHADCIMSWCTHRGTSVIGCPVCRQPQSLTGEAASVAAPQIVGGHVMPDIEVPQCPSASTRNFSSAQPWRQRKSRILHRQHLSVEDGCDGAHAKMKPEHTPRAWVGC
eukprot:s1144_g7.t2